MSQVPDAHPEAADLPGPDPGPAEATGILDLVEPIAEDRAATGAGVVRAASGALLDWLATCPDSTSWETLAASLGQGVEPLAQAHAWRGPVARWLTNLSQMLEAGQDGDLAPNAVEVLAEELGLWLGGAGAGQGPWSGEFLAEGRRLPDRRRCADALCEELDPGELIMVHGYSETVAYALEEVAGRGLRPEALVSEGGPDLGGRRMARRLVDAGILVRHVYDVALLNQVAQVDRVWLGTEAIGAESFLGLIGTTSLLREAELRSVPSSVLATSDKLQPEGVVQLPVWAEESEWLLWGDAPQGVRVEPQAYELVPTTLPDSFATERGTLSLADFSLLHLRTNALV